MALFKQKNQTLTNLKSIQVTKEREIQRLVENNLNEIFEMYFIATEYSITAGRRIDTLAVDKNGYPVIIEYKKRSDENVINQSISYLKWLKEQKQEFFERLIEKKVKDIPKEFKIRWNEPRVICIAESFNKFDLDTVEMITQIKLELYKYRFFEGNLFQLEQYNVEEKPESFKIKKGSVPTDSDALDLLLRKCSANVKSIFKELQARIFMLDANIEEKATTLYVAYRLSKNFAEIHLNKNDLKIHLRPASYKDPKGLVEKIPDGYNWTLNRRIYLRSAEEIDSVIGFIKQSYNDVL